MKEAPVKAVEDIRNRFGFRAIRTASLTGDLKMADRFPRRSRQRGQGAFYQQTNAEGDSDREGYWTYRQKHPLFAP
jgi:hypothetical protein